MDEETVLITLNDDDNVIAELRLTEEEFQNIEQYTKMAEIDLEEYIQSLLLDEVEKKLL